MRFWLTAAALAAALVLAGGPTARAATPCQMQELAELPVTVEGRNITIEALVNGRPARMIVDTRSVFTLLLRGGATQLGLTPAPLEGVRMTGYGVGGGDQSEAVRIKEFKVGGLVAHNLDILVTGHLAGEAQGLLGASFLLQADIEFDLPEGKLRFFRPRNCSGDQVVYWGQAYSVAPMLGEIDRSIQIDVLLNGAPIRAEMDSGANVTSVALAAAARAGTAPSAPTSVL